GSPSATPPPPELPPPAGPSPTTDPSPFPRPDWPDAELTPPEPLRSELTRTEPLRSELTRAEPLRTELTHAEPIRTEPADAEDKAGLTSTGAEKPVGAEPPIIDPNFEPANDVEAELLAAATDGQTDHFLSTLLLAKVLIPIPVGISTSIKPGEPGFVWRREQVEGQPYVVVFTSQERINEYLGLGVDTVSVKFVQLITEWP